MIAKINLPESGCGALRETDKGQCRRAFAVLPSGCAA